MVQAADADNASVRSQVARSILLICVIGIPVTLVLTFSLFFLRPLPGRTCLSETRNDIGCFESAVMSFNQAFGLDAKRESFPSRLVLCENYPDYFGPNKQIKSQLHADSLAFLQRMFPKLWKVNLDPIDWNGNGIAGDKPVVLEGDQCLVFFLGGIPATGQVLGCLGFSANPLNPAFPGGQRRGPFYEFTAERLVQIHGNKFYSYLDGYRKKPYAYFSSYGKRNGYNRYFSLDDSKSDCASLGVWPYAESIKGGSPQYVNPAKFQIISAGADGQFRPGTDLTAKSPFTWTPETADQIPESGEDDQGNFHSRSLGEPEPD
jgi:hypothetical protein